MQKLRIGVLGAGHLGKIHLKCIQMIDAFELTGFFDPDETQTNHVISEFGIRNFSDIDELIDQVDVVDIVTPTLAHYACASRSLKKFRHVFIEKPIVATPQEALSLMEIATEAGVKVQVGHVERFNPAFRAVQQEINKPMFIEAHRLAQFNPRGTDVPVILDLMIHDIDIVLSVVNSSIHKISASGVSVISETPDIANARIEFDNGCVANLTASRISLKNMRKTRFFQKDAYISVDFLKKEAEVVRMKEVDDTTDPLAMVIDTGKTTRQILFNKPAVEDTNAIRDELESFAQAILTNSSPPVTIMDGYTALDTAYRIIEKINSANNFTLS